MRVVDKTKWVSTEFRPLSGPAPNPDKYHFAGLRFGALKAQSICFDCVQCVLGGDDVTVQLPLALLATGANQRSLLRRIPNAFRGNGYAQTMREAYQSPHNSSIFLFEEHAMNKAAVDLDLVHLEISQVIQA